MEESRAERAKREMDQMRLEKNLGGNQTSYRRCEICNYTKDNIKTYTILYGEYGMHRLAINSPHYTHYSEKILGEISGGVCNSCKLKSVPKNIFLSPITSVFAFILATQFQGTEVFVILFLFSILWVFVSFFLFCMAYWYVSNIGGYLLFFKYRKKLKNSGYNGIKLKRDSPMFEIV